MQLPLRIAQTSIILSGCCLAAAGATFPSAEISNGPIHAKVYLINAENDFYHSTRFDWSGIIGSLTYAGHDYYGDWFSRIDPSVYDFGYDQGGVVSAPFSAMVGPAEEFNTNRAALGFDEAAPGGTFVKIGVGVLRKPDASRYDHSKTYVIVDGGKWTVHAHKNSVTFTQTLADPSSGYSYVYTKTVRLVPGKPELVLEHTLRNAGKKPIDSTVYDHNFWALDHLPPGPGLSVEFPFQIHAVRAPNPEFAEIRGNKLVYVKTLTGQDRVTAALQGFGDTPADYDIRVENRRAGAGVRIRGDRPLSNVVLWSIRTVMAVEPYITMSIEPGKEFTWRYTYDYYSFPPDKQNP